MINNLFKKNVTPILIIAIIILSLFSSSNNVQAAIGDNLAIGATASASFTNPGESASSAINGSLDANSRWTTYNTSSTEATFVVDFGVGSAKTFDQVRLYIYNDNGGVKTPASYSIQYWNGSAWINAVNQSKSPVVPGADLNTVEFNAVTADKLQVTFVSTAITTAGQGVGLYELQVYKTAPAVTLTSSEANPTNKSPFTLTASFDEVMENFTLADITVFNGSADNLQTNDNQTYTFDITPSSDGQVRVDVAAGAAENTAGDGNTAAQTFIIEYDSTAPMISGVTNGNSYNTEVKPTFTEGAATLSMNLAAAVAYTSGTSINGEGSYQLIVTDEAGNSHTVNFNIDHTVPVITGITDNELTNQDVIPVFNEGTATLNGDEFISGGHVTTDGTYTLVVTDQAGNTTTVHFIVDKTKPEAPLITASTTKPTYVAVNLMISYPNDAELKQFKVGDGDWQSYIGPVEVTSNKTIYARSFDEAGNLSEEISYVVSNIDTLSNTDFHINDVLLLINQQKDMNGDETFNNNDIQIMLNFISPIFNLSIP